MMDVTPKQATEVKFQQVFASYIGNELGQDPGEFSGGVTAMVDLRKSVCVAKPESYEGSIKALTKYYGLLLSASKRFPMAEGGRANISFTWGEVFEQGGMFSKSKKSSCSVEFEKACVMFNLGAVHSSIGKAANLKTDDGMKTSIDNFQKAAGYFKQLKATVEGIFGGRPPSSDLDPNLLDALWKIMLAQAQEAIITKSIASKMKDGLVAKLCMAGASMYGDAATAASSRKELKLWVPVLKAKNDYLQSVAQYRQGNIDVAADKYGPQLARLRESVTIGRRALEMSTGTPVSSMVKAHCDKVTGVLKEAENNNKLIYNAAVPALSSLPAITGQAVASADRPLPEFETEAVRGPDPFDKLLPFSVAKGVTDYKQSAADHVSSLVEKVRQSTRECVTALAEMNLPAAIQVSEHPDALPDSLLQQGQEINGKGGVEALTQMLDGLEEPRKKVVDMLDEADRLLQAEEREDSDMRQKHGARWTRTPSNELTGKTREEGTKFRTWLQQAIEGDGKIKQKFDENKSGIVVLCKPPDELNAIIPKATGTLQRTASGRDASGVEDLKALLTQLDQLRVQRDGLETKLEQAKENDHIQELLLQHADGSVDQPSLFAQQLSSVYGALETEVNQSVAKTTEVLSETRQANQVFVAGRESGQANEREGMVADLGVRYETALELFSNLEEGHKFYGKLFTMCKKYHNKVSDFVEARKIEKQETLADLTHSIAASETESYATHPAAPARSASGGNSYAQPPSQPPSTIPPPQQSHSPSTTTTPAYSTQPQYHQPPPQQYQPPPPPQQYQPPPPQQQHYTPQYQQPQQYGTAPQQYGAQYDTTPAPNAATIPNVNYGGAQAPPPTQQYQPQYPQPPPPTHQGYHPAMPAMPGPASNEWACPACSFYNNVLLPHCEMCDTRRP